MADDSFLLAALTDDGQVQLEALAVAVHSVQHVTQIMTFTEISDLQGYGFQINSPLPTHPWPISLLSFSILLHCYGVT